jgi:catechol 2,3-dioxygenase-like lactoylglutathione lyase family enzyme
MPSSHLGRSHAFYAGVLGLERTEAIPQANEYDAFGMPLRVTLVPDHKPSPFTALGWRVPDLHAAMADLASRGVRFGSYPGYEQDGDGIWTAPNGNRIAWFEDPDGNIIALHELP